MRVLITLLFLTVAAHAQEIVINNGIPRNAADARYVLRNPYYDGSQSVTVASATVTGPSFSVGGGSFTVNGTSISIGMNGKLTIFSPDDVYSEVIRLDRGTSRWNSIFNKPGNNAALDFRLHDSVSGTSQISALTLARIGAGVGAGINAISPSATLDVRNSGANTAIVQISSNNGTALMTVDNVGRVGVGTASPSAPVEISGARNSTQLRIRSDASGGTNPDYAELAFTASTADRYTASIRATQKFASAKGDLLFLTNDSGTPLYTSLSTRAVITDAGVFGIGPSTTPDPAAKLNVAGNISTTGQIISSGTGSNYFAGNIGIGTTSPKTLLDVAGSVSTITITSTKDGTWTVGESIGALDFYGSDTSGSGASVRAYIRPVANTTFGATAHLDIGINSNGATATRAMRIQNGAADGVARVAIGASNSADQVLTVAGNISLTGQVISSGAASNYFAGNVGIGTTAPTAVLTVQAPTTATDYIVKVSSNNTDTILYARQNGHIGVGGGIPTLGTCLNATISALSNDNAGTINFTGANSSCAIVWSVARTNTPVCVVSAAAANATEGAILSAQSASGFSVTPNTGAWDNGDAVNYICLGVK